MPITLPATLPAFDVLKNEGVMVMTPDRAAQQDIRPLRIGLLNLMPKKIQTENQFARLIGATPLQIDFHLIRMSEHQTRNTAAEHMETFYRPFAEVEQELRRAVIADARRRFTETRAAGLLAAQRGGKTLAEAAQELGLISSRTAPFGRDPAQGSPVPPELLPPLFEAKRGEATMAEIRGGFAVASVAEILRLDPMTDPLGMGRVRVEIEQAVGDDLEQQFQAALRVRANVRINERLLDQVTGR